MVEINSNKNMYFVYNSNSCFLTTLFYGYLEFFFLSNGYLKFLNFIIKKIIVWLDV